MILLLRRPEASEFDEAVPDQSVDLPGHMVERLTGRPSCVSGAPVTLLVSGIRTRAIVLSSRRCIAAAQIESSDGITQLFCVLQQCSRSPGHFFRLRCIVLSHTIHL
ncbi:MAG: hypothetical protein ACK58T_11810, partial [Phycisphaerae bacterium]